MSARSNKIVAVTRSWIGTPYRHQASVKQAGCDCLGLVRGVYAELYGREAETPPPYSPDWAEAQKRETMLEAAGRHLVGIAAEAVAPGDVLIFRLRSGFVAKHAAILATPSTMIHAVEGAPVCEVSYSNWWRRHLAAAFQFPNLS